MSREVYCSITQVEIRRVVLLQRIAVTKVIGYVNVKKRGRANIRVASTDRKPSSDLADSELLWSRLNRPDRRRGSATVLPPGRAPFRRYRVIFTLHRLHREKINR